MIGLAAKGRGRVNALINASGSACQKRGGLTVRRLNGTRSCRPSAGYLPFWIFVIVKPLSPLSASNLMVSPTLSCLSIARSLTS